MLTTIPIPSQQGMAQPQLHHRVCCLQGVNLLVPTTYYVIHFIGISFFVGLATYVYLSRDRRPIHRPLILFLLIQAAQFGAMVLVELQSAGGLDSHLVWTLRARLALALFSLPLFIHMAAYLMQGAARQRAFGFARLGYTLAAGAAIITLGTRLIVVAPGVRAIAGAAIVGPVLTRAAFDLGGVWDICAWIGAVSILLYARRRHDAPGSRADLIRLSTAWLFLLTADLAGVAALLAERQSPLLADTLGNLQYLTYITTVVILATGILRYGSPAGAPMLSAKRTSALLAATALVGLGLVPLLDPSAQTRVTMLIAAPLAGALAGALLGQVDRRSNRPSWSEDLLAPLRGSFTRRLGAAWEELALGTLSGDMLERLRQALKNEIGASYVVWLDAHSRRPERTTYQDQSGYMRLTLKETRAIAWPLIPPSHHLASEHSLPAPVGMALPISVGEPGDTLLVVGERQTGGVFGGAELEKIRRFAHLLAVARKAAVAHNPNGAASLGTFDGSSSAMAPQHRPALWIRTLGGLEVDGGQEHPLPLRARQALAHLLLAFPRPISGDSLMARMWPERSAKAAANNLYVAIYALRRALEPDLQPGEESRYVVREGEFYRLVRRAPLQVDCWVLEETHRWAMAGQDESRPDDQQRLITALQLYGGRFLADASLEPSAEWEAVGYRLSRMFLDLVHLALANAEEAQDWRLAEQVLLHALEVEPDAEDWQAQLADIQTHLQAKGPHTLASHAAYWRSH